MPDTNTSEIVEALRTGCVYANSLGTVDESAVHATMNRAADEIERLSALTSGGQSIEREEMDDADLAWLGEALGSAVENPAETRERAFLMARIDRILAALKPSSVGDGELGSVAAELLPRHSQPETAKPSEDVE